MSKTRSGRSRKWTVTKSQEWTLEGPFWDENAGDEYNATGVEDDGTEIVEWGHTPEGAVAAAERALAYSREPHVPCPCCGKGQVHEGGHDICKVCWWHDDPSVWGMPDKPSGANVGNTLNQAKANVAAYGYCDPHGMWCGTGRYPDGYSPDE